MQKILLPTLAATMISMSAAVAQYADPYGFDKVAQTVTVTRETLTRAHCDAGYQQGMSMSKAEFERQCELLSVHKPPGR